MPNPTMIYPQDDALSEAIVIPFHEPRLARELDFTLTTSTGARAESTPNWADTRIAFRPAKPGDWAEIDVPVDVATQGYDTLQLAARLPADLTVSLAARMDAQPYPDHGAKSANIAEDRTVQGERLHLSATLAGDRLRGVRIRVTAAAPGRFDLSLCWVRLIAGDLRERIERQSWPVDRAWPTLIKPDADWGEIALRRGLLFDVQDLPGLRNKCLSDDWKSRFDAICESARRSMQRDPEDDLGMYLPWPDRRYTVPRHPHLAFGNDSIDLCFAGLILDDRAMLRQAARFLMCIVHTRHWCQSEESRTVGLTWDQRCFLEEIHSTAASLLADWLDFALTDTGRALVDQALWDRGLSIIERDIMKFQYVHHNNQGPWFGRARILGALMLEASWPHVGDLADRAKDKVLEGLTNYILDDGGTDEGVGYMAATINTSFVGLAAYARARGVTVREMLPGAFEHLGRYFATMSASKPNHILAVGDCAKDQIRSDVLPMLARIFPEQGFERMLDRHFELETDPYLRQYKGGGVYGLILGPEELGEAQCVVPTFSLLKHTGHASSYRHDGAGRSLRIHVNGCKAAPSHTHYDQSSLLVECDGESLLVDRGTVRYDDTRSIGMKYSSRHNVLTPLLEDGSAPDQVLPVKQAVIPDATGDAERFEATVDLHAVWDAFAEKIQRHIVSESVDAWTVTDRGRWREPTAMVQHWHALSPFMLVDGGAELEHAGVSLRIEVPWACEIRQAEDSIDCNYRPVYHLELIAPAGQDFELTTRFRRVDS